MTSQRIVRFEAVWHHVCSPTEAGEGGAMAFRALEPLDSTALVARSAAAAARRTTLFAVGETLAAAARVVVVGLVGVGDAVEVREGRFVGEGSKAGKSPRGCWRVATIVSIEASRLFGRGS